MAAILVLQNNETAAMFVYQTNPLGVEFFFNVNTPFCSNKFVWMLATWVKTLYNHFAPRIFNLLIRANTKLNAK